MFWGIRLDNRSGKIQAKNNFKVSNAALDLSSINDGVVVSVWVLAEGKHTLLANLSRNVSQTQIDVAFGKEQVPEFYLRAEIPATVYLSGYYIIDDDIQSDNDDASSYTTNLGRIDSFQHQFGSQTPLKRKLNESTVISSMTNNAYANNFDMNKMIVLSDPHGDKKDELDMIMGYSSVSSAKKLKFEAKGSQNLSGGVNIEDVTEGDGKVVGKGSTVKIKYTVSPASSTFQSQSSELEVSLSNRKTMSCWKIGIPGMKVGGVRKITSPPSQAYGSKGIPPFINGETDVVFEVQVLNCNK